MRPQDAANLWPFAEERARRRSFWHNLGTYPVSPKGNQSFRPSHKWLRRVQSNSGHMWAGYKVGLSRRGYSAQVSCLIRWMVAVRPSRVLTCKETWLLRKYIRRVGPWGFWLYCEECWSSLAVSTSSWSLPLGELSYTSQVHPHIYRAATSTLHDYAALAIAD